MFLPEIDEVHVSVAFTWDLPRAEWLAYQWQTVGVPVKMGGPACGTRGEEFVPGRYIKGGYTITSRGCPNRCWFCSVWKRDGDVRELQIREGWNILDDNLLACSSMHIRDVFEMLKSQDRRAEFTGGIEAARLEPWHVDLFQEIHPNQIFFAYDEEPDFEPLMVAGKMMQEAGFERHTLRAYVLIGYPGDTIGEAEKRLRATVEIGIFPMAMLWRGDKPQGTNWKQFQRFWARPAAIYGRRDPLDFAHQTERSRLRSSHG
jgi:hypothetical protein